MHDRYDKRGYLLEDFRLFHLSEAPSSRIDYHYHEFHKLLLLVSGTGCYSIEGTRYSLTAGDMVLVGSRCVHRPEFVVPYERMILYIAPEFLRQLSTDKCDLAQCFSGETGYVLRANGSLLPLMEQLEQELSADAFGSDIAAKGLILKLLVEICRLQKSPDQVLPVPITPKDLRIADLLGHIDAHLSEELSVDSLAEQCYLSKFHLMRLFRENTGTTLHTYITERRLLQAKNLIAAGMNATEACYHSGFKSYSSFTRAYSKHFGTTPTGRKDRRTPAEETYE